MSTNPTNAAKYFKLQLPDLKSTDALAAAFARAVEERAIVALLGPLGAGKTRLVQGVAQALGIDEVVSSPTFTMMNEYHSGRLPLYHLDLYRLSEGEAVAMAPMLAVELSEILSGPGIVIIEWADLLTQPSLSDHNFLAPLDHLVVRLAYDETVKEIALDSETSEYKEGEGRQVVIESRGPGSEVLVEKIFKSIGRVVANS